MKENSIQNAKKLAKVFIESVHRWEREQPFGGFYNKHSADIKRKSMDLSRALSEMRRP